MNAQFQKNMRISLAATLVLLFLYQPTIGDDTATSADPNSVDSDRGKNVELFEAMESGEIDVRFVPRDSKRANVLIENKSAQPLHIRLPEAFAGVPIQAQIGGGLGGGGLGGGGLGGGGLGGGGLGGGGLGGGGGGQALGGGFGGGGGGFGGGGGGFGGGGLGGGGLGGGGLGGGGMFNIAPGKMRKIEVATACLEHGKPDPSPRMHYVLQPIHVLTDNPEVLELCKLVGSGRLHPAAAQAAAWHLANGLSWAQLARKVGVRHLNGATEPYFTRQELLLGMQVAKAAVHRARERSAPTGSRAEAEGTESEDHERLFEAGLRHSEQFRQQLLGTASGLSRVQLLGQALPGLLPKLGKPNNVRINPDEFVKQLRGEGQIDGLPSFGIPSGHWRSQESDSATFTWHPVERFQPALQLDSSLPPVLATRYCVTDDGFGWNYVVALAGDPSRQVVLGVFYSTHPSGSSPTARPHVGYAVGQRTMVWIGPSEIRLDTVSNEMRATVTGLDYMIHGGKLSPDKNLRQSDLARHPTAATSIRRAH